MSSVDEIQMNHRIALVCFAFTARLHARLATNAAIRIDEEFVLLRNRHS